MIKKRGIVILLILGVFFLTQNLESSWTLKRLTWNTGNSHHPAIATDSNNHIHVVWYDYHFGRAEICYKKSIDGGATWTSFQRLTWNVEHSYHPDIATDSNNHIHVVWYDYSPVNWEIFYKKSTDGGATWSNKRLTWNVGDSESPTIAVDSNNHIHVVWHDKTSAYWEIFYKKSTDGGASWTQKRLTWNTGWSYTPDIATDSNNHIHVVWHDGSPGNYEILYKKSTDGGATWSNKRLTWNSGSSFSASIAVDSNNHIHVVWHDYSPVNWEILYKKSTDGGATWSNKRLTWNAGDSRYAAIATDSNNHIHVVWYDKTPGNFEIFYKQSTDGGVGWSQERLTWNVGNSYHPAIAADSNNHIHVVWHDYSPVNWEILYKKKD